MRKQPLSHHWPWNEFNETFKIPLPALHDDKEGEKELVAEKIALLAGKTGLANSQIGTTFNDHEIWNSDYTKEESWDLLCAGLDIKVVRCMCSWRGFTA